MDSYHPVSGRACAQAAIIRKKTVSLSGDLANHTEIVAILSDCEGARRVAAEYDEMDYCVDQLRREWSISGELYPLGSHLPSEQIDKLLNL